MPSPKLTPEQAAKQKQKLKEFHENGKKGLAPTSAGAIKSPKALGTVRQQFTNLSPVAINIVSKALTGDLIAEKTIWKGSEADKITILEKDPSASFEWITLDNGKEVEVLVEYVPVNKQQMEVAKYVLGQEIALKKAAEDSKLRKLEAALKEKKARDEGAIKASQEELAEKAKSFGGPRLITEFIPPEDEEDESDE